MTQEASSINKVNKIIQYSDSDDSIRVSGIVNDSITDGPGLRFTLFTQGCPHGCKGCHNPQTHPFSGGKVMSADEIYNMICANPIITGVTFSGGDPICQAKPLSNLAQRIKSKNLELAVYTGYTWESLAECKDEYVKKLLSYTDVVVDGEFDLSRRSLALKFKGSPNQRTIDVQKSLHDGCVVLKEDGRWN